MLSSLAAHYSYCTSVKNHSLLCAAYFLFLSGQYSLKHRLMFVSVMLMFLQSGVWSPADTGSLAETTRWPQESAVLAVPDEGHPSHPLMEHHYGLFSALFMSFSHVLTFEPLTQQIRDDEMYLSNLVNVLAGYFPLAYVKEKCVLTPESYITILVILSQCCNFCFK